MSVESVRRALRAGGLGLADLEEFIGEAVSAEEIGGAVLAAVDTAESSEDMSAIVPTTTYAFSALLDILSGAAHRSREEDVRNMLVESLVGLLVEEGAVQTEEEEEEDEGREEVVIPEWRWPVVADRPGSGGLVGDFREFSALGMFGYSVAKKTGWPQEKRRQFLGDFIESELPPRVEREFSDEYGRPWSVTRLRKVANVIAHNCSNRVRNDPGRYRHAIESWKEDLRFLKETYYEGHGMKFYPWPDPEDV